MTTMSGNGEMELTDLGDSGEQAGAALLQGETIQQVADARHSASDLEAVYDVPVTVSAVLGKSGMEVSQLLKLSKGTVVELDRKVGEAIDIYVNNRLVARGEVVLVEDRLGVTMTEIIKAGQS
jgi:flagellar motor switch protein FliN/FliY